MEDITLYDHCGCGRGRMWIDTKRLCRTQTTSICEIKVLKVLGKVEKFLEREARTKINR